MDKGVVECLYNNNKDDFIVDIRHLLDDGLKSFILVHPFKYLLERTLGPQCIVHHGYMKKGGWFETYIHFYIYHEQITQQYNKLTWIMGGRGDVMIYISTSPITISTFSVIAKGIVADIFRGQTDKTRNFKQMPNFLFFAGTI